MVIDILRLFFFFGSEKSTTKREKKKRALVVAFFFSEVLRMDEFWVLAEGRAKSRNFCRKGKLFENSKLGST